MARITLISGVIVAGSVAVLAGCTHLRTPEGFVADKNKGCLIALNTSSSVKSALRVFWSGNCAEGYAEGPGDLKIYVSNNLLREGKVNYSRGHITGHGVLRKYDVVGYATRKQAYTGDFKDDLPDGQGEIEYEDRCEPNRTMDCSMFGSCQPRNMAACIVKYKGAWRKGYMHGYGVALLGSGEIYKGNWEWDNRVSTTAQEQRYIVSEQQRKQAERDDKQRGYAALANRIGSYDPVPGSFPKKESTAWHWVVSCREGGAGWAFSNFSTPDIYCGGSNIPNAQATQCGMSLETALRSACRGGH